MLCSVVQRGVAAAGQFVLVRFGPVLTQPLVGRLVVAHELCSGSDWKLLSSHKPRGETVRKELSRFLFNNSNANSSDLKVHF